MYLKEIFAGRYAKAPAVTEFPNAEQLNELMIVGPITRAQRVLAPPVPDHRQALGRRDAQRAHSNLIGLSKYARLAEWIMCRPQIQEEAVAQMADLLQEKMNPDGLAHRHGGRALLHALARRDATPIAKMTNSVMRGVVPQGRQAAPRIPDAAQPESPLRIYRCWSA